MSSDNNPPQPVSEKKTEAPITRGFNRDDINAIVNARTTQSMSPVTDDPIKGVFRLELIENRHSFMIPLKPLIILGRPDPITNEAPDIDFTTLAGYRMGVSRRHARITLKDQLLYLHDLGSSNGTFLNGDRLKVNQPQPIYNGDEIRLGRLAMYAYYEIQGERTVIPLRGLDED